MRYIEMHREPAAYGLGPPPSRGRDLELEGGVNACHVQYVYESGDSHVRGIECRRDKLTACLYCRNFDLD